MQPAGLVGPCLLSAPRGCKGQDTHAAEKTPEHMSSLQLSYPTLHRVLLMCSMAFLPARPGKHWGLTWCPHTWPRDSCWVGYHGPSQLWSQVLPCSGLCPPDGRELGCCDERPVDACVAFAMWDEVASWGSWTQHPLLPLPRFAVEITQSCAVQLHKLRFNLSFI